MGLLEILTIIFVVLKLVGVITWSWWIVFLPIIISLAVYLLLYMFVGTVFFSIFKK